MDDARQGVDMKLDGWRLDASHETIGSTGASGASSRVGALVRILRTCKIAQLEPSAPRQM
jgi:hypothetical protein